MRFPPRLSVMVRDRATGFPVDSVAIVLRLFAVRKNDYYIGPAITTREGTAEFTFDDCTFAIAQAQKMFVMDYGSTLAECRPMAEVSLHEPERLAGMIRQYRSAPAFWGLAFRDPEALMDALQNAKNAEYEPESLTATEEQILLTPTVELLLSKKRTAN